MEELQNPLLISFSGGNNGNFLWMLNFVSIKYFKGSPIPGWRRSSSRICDDGLIMSSDKLFRV